MNSVKSWGKENSANLNFISPQDLLKKKKFLASLEF